MIACSADLDRGVDGSVLVALVVQIGQRPHPRNASKAIDVSRIEPRCVRRLFVWRATARGQKQRRQSDERKDSAQPLRKSAVVKQLQRCELTLALMTAGHGGDKGR